MNNKDNENLNKNNKKRSVALLAWLTFSVLASGFLYLIIEWGFRCCTDSFNNIFKNLFYVVNKEAYNGYFYAWSITLVAGVIATLWINRDTISEKKASKIYVILGVVILLFSLGLYLQYTWKENVEFESFIGSLKLEKPDDMSYMDIFTTSKAEVDKRIDSIITTIDTEEFVKEIDKEKLKESLVRINYEKVDPILHNNWRLVSCILLSLLYSIFTLCFIYPKPKKDKKEDSK